jgi:hypothetical protein
MSSQADEQSSSHAGEQWSSGAMEQSRECRVQSAAVSSSVEAFSSPSHSPSCWLATHSKPSESQKPKSKPRPSQPDRHLQALPPGHTSPTDPPTQTSRTPRLPEPAPALVVCPACKFFLFFSCHNQLPLFFSSSSFSSLHSLLTRNPPMPALALDFRLPFE